jgi:hypothetical protein
MNLIARHLILAALIGLSTAGLLASAVASTRQDTAAGPREDEHLARQVCGTCHAFPPPDLLPKSAWRDEFIRMTFIRDRRPLPPATSDLRRQIPLPEDFEKVLPYYTSRAPERLPASEPWPDPAASPVKFERRALTPSQVAGAPAVSNVRLVDLDGDKRLDLLATEMQHGLVLHAPSVAKATDLAILANLPHPDRVTPTDLDGDGALDLLVADLGEFFPRDHDKGAVILLRAAGSGKFDAAMWLDGWPRVADVQAADFNGDGKLDLVVAAFGYYATGHVVVLENQTTSYDRATFTAHKVDARTGALQAIPVDLNRDGHMDFVTQLAQEHETVVAYINRGTKDFTFDQHVIFAAPHPNWGSTGIELVDFDADGDSDLLLTHGDTFDDGLVKPYHGIQLLENTGSFPWKDHRVALMPGVHRARAADLDGDGDLDVVATALLAGGSDVDEAGLPALVWLEQTRPLEFVKHTIQMGFPRSATLDVGDIDSDGDIDIVTGNFAANRAVSSWIDVWSNLRK